MVMSTRILGGVIAIGVAAATLVVVSLGSLPTVQQRPAGVTVTPVPTPARLVCPGSVLRLGELGGENASTALAIGQPRYVTAATAGSASTVSLQTGGGAVSGGEPVLVTGDDDTASIAAAEYHDVDSGDYRGLAAAACDVPSTDVWLVGGATTVGRTTLLTLANPNAVPSTAAIEIVGPEGAVEAPGLTGITVPANGQRTLSIAGFAPDLAEFVVHVTSRGGPILANLQFSIVRGIEPGGVDIVGATAVPATKTVIAGLVVLGADAVSERLGEPGYEDLPTTLRLYVPGEVEAAATVRIIPEGDSSAEGSSTGGSTAGASFQLVVQPGVVTDVPIESLVDGSYSVIVETTVPVIAAVRASTVAGVESPGPSTGTTSTGTTSAGTTSAGTSDVAWFAGATPLGDAAFTSVAPGDGAQLHLANPGTAPITATINGAIVTVPGGGAVAMEVFAGASYRIDRGAGLFASISFASAGRLASYLISSGANVESPVVIYP